SEDCTARVWNTDAGTLRGVLKGHAPYAAFRLPHNPWGLQQSMVGPMRRAMFSPGDRHILTLSEDTRPRYQVRPGERYHHLPWPPVRLWDRQTLREVLALPGVDRKIVTAALSPDGQRLLVAEGWPQGAWYFDRVANSLNSPDADRRRTIPPI